jgi:hypothetical protein
MLMALLAGPPLAYAQTAPELWRLDRLDSLGGHPVTIAGAPRLIETPIGKAIQFNGKDTALTLAVHPLAGASTWTWEMIFRPDADGAAAQRVFHLQVNTPARDPNGRDITDRMLFEIRIVPDGWCLDSFATTGGQHATLLDCTRVHPFGPFYRVTAVYDGTTLRNYVGDQLQGEAVVLLAPQGPGSASIGVRMDRRDWFKGAIYEARFTRRALPVKDFLPLPPVQ